MTERCECCGRHISELKPFGGPGDPLLVDHTGELLVETLRFYGYYSKEAQNAMEEYEKACPLVIKSKLATVDGIDLFEYEERENAREWFVKKFGKEKGEELYHGIQLYETLSWECRDCIVLDLEEFFEKEKRCREQKKKEIVEQGSKNFRDF